MFLVVLWCLAVRVAAAVPATRRIPREKPRDNRFAPLVELPGLGGAGSDCCALARRHSHGFLADVPDATWMAMRANTLAKSWYANASDPLQDVDDPERWLANNMVPTFECPRVEKVGKQNRAGVMEGSKLVCYPQRLSRDGCLVYSVGSAGDFKFEDALWELTAGKCEIHIFDPANWARPGDESRKNIHYHAWGLASTYDASKSVVWPGRGRARIGPGRGRFMTFQETLSNLGHTERRIDMLKIDCEGCEWSSLKDWIGGGFQHILVELHGVPNPRGTPRARWYKKPMNVARDYYDHFAKHGYALYAKDRNGALGLELSFLKLDDEYWDPTPHVVDPKMAPAAPHVVDRYMVSTPRRGALDELELLTGGRERLVCTPPLSPFRNVVRAPDESDVIPRVLHVSTKSRCVARDDARTLQRWQEKLPGYSIFLHDDERISMTLPRRALLSHRWFMAAEPQHPIMYMSMLQIINHIFAIPDIRSPRVVFVTGPHATKHGYFKFLNGTCCGGRSDQDAVFRNGVVMDGMYGKQSFKMRGDGIITSKYGWDDIVPYNATLNVTRRQRHEMDSGIMHWTHVNRGNARRHRKRGKLSCGNYLRKVDAGLLEAIPPVRLRY